MNENNLFQEYREIENREIEKDHILNYLIDNLKEFKDKYGEDFLKFVFTIDTFELLGEEVSDKDEIIKYLDSKQTEEGTWKGEHEWEQTHYVPNTAQALMIYKRWGLKPEKSLKPFFETIDTWDKVVDHVEKYDKGNFWGGLWGYIICYVSQDKELPWKNRYLEEVNEKYSEWSESNHQRTHVIGSLMALHEKIPKMNEIISKTVKEQNEDGKWIDKGWNYAIPQTFFNIALLNEMSKEKEVNVDVKEEIEQAVNRGIEFIRSCYVSKGREDNDRIGLFHYSSNEDSIEPIETAMGTAAIYNLDLYVKWIKSLMKNNPSE